MNFPFFFFRIAISISCYQCNSTDIQNQFQCSEFMDTYDFGLSAQPCTDVYNAAYCVKLIGRYEGTQSFHVHKIGKNFILTNVLFLLFPGGLGVKRYCSSHDLGNYCNYVRQPGDNKEYRTCVYTCNSDGCNGSSLVKSFGFLIGITLLPMFSWLSI